jgi:hypothetical protein
MYLRQTIYQLGPRVKALVPAFHKSHIENLVFMIVGIAYSRSVSLPAVANHVPIKKIQIESRVQRFERLLDCGKFVPLEAMKPVATRILKRMQRSRQPIMILMDRTMINDQTNLLYVALAFGRRALPLGWVEVPHEGNSNLALQKKLLGWLRECLPASRQVSIVADREFHSIHLARWIACQMKAHFVLRIKAGTWIEIKGHWYKAGEMATKGKRRLWESVKVTGDRKADYRVNLLAVWDKKETEPWLLISDREQADLIEATYKKRYWVEEMFSDNKSRGLNLEATRITDSARVQRLLVAVTLAYLWIMEIGSIVVASNQWRKVDNRGAQRSVSLCQIGLRWLREKLLHGVLPPLFTCRFKSIGES